MIYDDYVRHFAVATEREREAEQAIYRYFGQAALELEELVSDLIDSVQERAYKDGLNEGKYDNL